jgi:hypothetical protein
MAAAEKPAAEKKAAAVGDLGQAEVQAKFDEADAKGYFGEVPEDDTDYTLRGVTKDTKKS